MKALWAEWTAASTSGAHMSGAVAHGLPFPGSVVVLGRGVAGAEGGDTVDVEAFARLGFDPFAVDEGFVAEDIWVVELWTLVS